jgi:hypothetical protein
MGYWPILVVVALTPTLALAQSCNDEVGAELAAVYVDQCIEVSPATRPPCNAENSCELIQNEIVRGCALIDEEAPEDVPDFCAEYIQYE